MGALSAGIMNIGTLPQAIRQEVSYFNTGSYTTYDHIYSYEYGRVLNNTLEEIRARNDGEIQTKRNGDPKLSKADRKALKTNFKNAYNEAKTNIESTECKLKLKP